MKHNNQYRWSLLMTLSQKGDNDAYETLLTELSMVLKSYFYKRLHNKDFVDDLVQDSLLNIHHSRHTYDVTRPFTSWFFAIAHHKLVDFIRKNKLKSDNEQYNETHFDQLCNDSKDNIINIKYDLENAIKQLPYKQQKAIEYLKLKGYSVKESASQLGISDSALKVNAHRAYKALKKILGTQ